ncbi:MAG TPA: hypothetical protein VI653_05620, partial [Steroidobacteraceae bacterium]
MEKSAVVAQLAWLTAGLTPAAQATPEELRSVREALARSLLSQITDFGAGISGLPVAPSAGPSASELAILGELVDGIVTEPATPSVPRVFRRSVPRALVGNPALAPAASVGMRTQSFGPFVDRLGALHWFDIIPPLQQTFVTRSGDTTPFICLPLRVPVAGPMPATFPVGPGSLWVEAKLLAPDAPLGGYAGISISGGTLTLTAPPTAISGGLQTGPSTTLTLTVSTAGAAGPTGGSGPGADGGAVVAQVPSEVTIEFTPTGAQITAAAAAFLQACGNSVALSWQNEPSRYESGLAQIFIPYSSTSNTFNVATLKSDLFEVAGSAPIVAAAWAWPVAVTPPAQLGAASTAGYLAVLAGSGLKGNWQGLVYAPAHFGAMLLEVASGSVTLLGFVLGASRLGMDIKLWPNEPPPPQAHSSLELKFPTATVAHFSSVIDGTGGAETLTMNTTVSAHIDRPVAADGQRLGPELPGQLVLFETGTQRRLLIVGQAAPTNSPPLPISLAMRNALIVTTPPVFMLVAGSYKATPQELASGGALLAFGVQTLLPTLPDPYAANFLPLVNRDGVARTSSVLLATVLWSQTKATTLEFSDAQLSNASFQIKGLPPSPMPQVTNEALLEDAARLQQLDEGFNDALGGIRPELFLLDVSSNVDQFGVALGVAGRRDVKANLTETSSLAISGLDLVAPEIQLRVFTPPAVQWEPVVTVQNPATLPNPFPSPAGFLNDGGPTLMGVNDVTLVPVAPAPLIDGVVASYAGGKRAAVRFTLPFGISALAALPARPEKLPIHVSRATLRNVRPDFASQQMTGGIQLALTAPVNFLALNKASPSLPGAAIQLRNLVDANGNPITDSRPPPAPGGLALSVLGPEVDTSFNSQFGPGAKSALAPVTRIDFSGYGASTFSAWTDPGAVPPAVVQVRFTVMLGRASHEVVQVKSILYPWNAVVVRTITVDRQDDAEISRYDSGWVAATPGRFDFGAITVHPGALLGAFNIREIRDTSQKYSAGTLEMVGVYFDADLQIEGVISGASGGFVPTSGQFGYVQTAPANTPATASQLAALLAERGPLGGPVDCVISVGGTGQTMRVSRVEVDNAPHPGAPETHEFGAMARGSVVLPQPGSWSVVARTDTTGEPTPVDPERGVPLIRQGRAGGPASTAPWRLAEAIDLWTPTTPSMDYCLMHATDSSRLLFPRTQIANGAAAFTSDQTPLLADGFALMGATSIFPRQDACLRFPASNYSLQIGGAGAFTLANVPPSFAPSMPSRVLSTGSVGTIGFEYADENGTPARISVAVSPNAWSVGLRGVNVRLDMSPFNALMRTAGDFLASSSAGVSMQSGRLVLGSVLSPLEEMLSFLAQLGLPNPLALSFANAGSSSSTSYKLKAGLTFSLPSPLLPVLTPLLQTPEWKIGLSVKTGFGNSASSAGDLFTSSSQWSFFFNLSGSIQWAIFPPIYAGGLLGLGIQANFPAGTRPQSQQLSFQIGVVASVGGDIVPGVLKLQGQVSFAFMLIIGTGPATTVTIGCGLALSVSGQILSGLVGITFAAAANGLVTVTDPKSVQATFDVSVDVVLCWFLDITFDVAFQ